MMNCVIIDDEPLAREGLSSYVREVDFLQLVATCTNPVELIRLLDEHPVDLIFLDIQMPKMNGIDFLKIRSETTDGDYYYCISQLCTGRFSIECDGLPAETHYV